VAAHTSLKVGDKFPEYTFIHLINYPTSTARASDFRGKLLLLDFWSTGCTSCIESWPKLEKLQYQFAGQIQILLVNPWQNESVVRPLIEKRRKAGIVDLTIPTVCEDRALRDLFAVTTVPHIVWVDAAGVIRSISSGSELNATNIEAMLTGTVKMPQKEEEQRAVGITLEAPDDRVLWQSTFSAYRRGMRSTHDAFAKPEMGYFLRVLNFPSRELYRYAYSRVFDRYGYIRFTPRSRVQLATRDSLYLQGGPPPHADTSAYYCYEIVSGRPTTVAEMQARMRHDLQGQFPWKVQWEKQVRRCLVLTATDTILLRYTGGRYALNITDADFQVNKVTITNVIEQLEESTLYALTPYPFVDETHYRGRIGGIDVSVNVYDIEALRRALLPHGLSLQLADRTVDVLVISDRVENSDR
jgi:thiol-disulfide isomerase/thioredoxin